MGSKLILLTLLVLVHVNFEFVQAPWLDFDNDDDDYYDDDDDDYNDLNGFFFKPNTLLWSFPICGWNISSYEQKLIVIFFSFSFFSILN